MSLDPQASWQPPDRFVIFQQIPRDLWDDKPALNFAIEALWLDYLRQAGGRRMPGPLMFEPIYWASIDDNLMEEVVTGPRGAWTYVYARISGPALRPGPV